MRKAESVDELFEQTYVKLVRALGVAFEPEAAADAVQEAFIEADRRWSVVSQYEDPRLWVRRVAVRRLQNARRNRVRRAEILRTIRPVAARDLSADLIDLRQALSELPDRMRLAVSLHYLCGSSVEEVASIMAVRPGTVKSALHEARKQLRTKLEWADD